MHQRYRDLTALADHYRTDKGSPDGDRYVYTALYAACFESFRLKSFNLLQLGLLRSAGQAGETDPANRIPSVDMWLDYFPRAHVYGFDLTDFSAFRRPRFTCIRGDLSNNVHLDQLAQAVPAPRIIIDDASHASFHQQRTLLRLFPLLQPGGFYIIEGLHDTPSLEAQLPPCRRMAEIVHEFLDTGALRLDFGTANQQQAIAEGIQHCFIHNSARGRGDFGPRMVIFQKARNAAPPPDADAWLTPGWLTSRDFAFQGSGPDRVSLRFELTGRIAGHQDTNEAGWRIQNGCLVIQRDDGQPACIAAPYHNPDGSVSLIGPLLQDAGVVYRFDEILRDAKRPRIDSFDLFDTLVARRCHDPIAIFRNIETQSGVKDFANIRQSLERRLWHAGDYGFDAIYDLIGKETGWDKASLDRLKMMELAEEWANLFPITSMTARVAPNDLIVSDMYLPPAFIRRLVDAKCGLRGRPVYLSSHGKSRGGIWTKLLTNHDIGCHYGDNQGSDIDGPRKAGIRAEHVTVASWTRGEKILHDLDLAPFARAVREARLSFYDQNEDLMAAAGAQFEFNLPLMILASIDVLYRAAQRDVDVLLMCARDCNLWVLLMQVLAGRSLPDLAVRYIYASRMMMVSGGPEYLAYVEQVSGQRTMLINVSGTGRSPSHFIGANGKSASTSLYLLTASPSGVMPVMDELAPARSDVDVTILEHLPNPIRMTIECLNMSLEDKSVRMGFDGHSFRPVFEPNEFGHAARDMISAMRRAFLSGVAIIERDGIAPPATIPADALVNAVHTLMLMAPDYHVLIDPIRGDVERADNAVMIKALAEQSRRRNGPLPNDGIGETTIGSARVEAASIPATAGPMAGVSIAPEQTHTTAGFLHDVMTKGDTASPPLESGNGGLASNNEHDQPRHALDEIMQPSPKGIIAELTTELYGEDSPLAYADSHYKDYNYPHTNLIPEVVASVLDIAQPRFWLELGSMLGGSAIRVADVVKSKGVKTDIVCIDPFTGDVNMWDWEQPHKKSGKWQFLRLERGRPTIYDRFLANVAASDHSDIILPIAATSIVGTKLLRRLFHNGRISSLPSVIYLDSAHEPDETFLELQNCWAILEPGGILMGDDWGWDAVRTDVNRFVKTVQVNVDKSRQLAERHTHFTDHGGVLLDRGQWVIVK